MNILVLGSGGREHALAWKIQQSSKCDNLYVAPGNAGTKNVANNVDLAVNDFEGIADFCIENQINLVVVGPEAPLVEGVVDYFKSRTDLQNIKIVGPGKAGAQLEGSKDFSKQFMLKHGVPTAGYKTFYSHNLEEGMSYIDQQTPPIVLKADGLAAGKGVIITESKDEAKAVLREMIADKKFGDASSKVVIEDFLSGIELSVFVLTDGDNYVVLPEAKDYKRIGENDTGLNTGGMGAVSPVPFADDVFMAKVKDQVIDRTIAGLKAEGIDYVGFIFIGLMNDNGNPYVVEYNVRLGDPEAEVILPRIDTDIVEVLIAAAEGKLDDINLSFTEQAATTVMTVSGGYPGSYEKGKVISGIESVEDAIVFHAGTKEVDGNVVTNGGRVISITAFGEDIPSALQRSINGAKTIDWEGKYFRKDIGLDLLKLTETNK